MFLHQYLQSALFFVLFEGQRNHVLVDDDARAHSLRIANAFLHASDVPMCKPPLGRSHRLAGPKNIPYGSFWGGGFWQMRCAGAL